MLQCQHTDTQVNDSCTWSTVQGLILMLLAPTLYLPGMHDAGHCCTIMLVWHVNNTPTPQHGGQQRCQLTCDSSRCTCTSCSSFLLPYTGLALSQTATSAVDLRRTAAREPAEAAVSAVEGSPIPPLRLPVRRLPPVLLEVASSRAAAASISSCSADGHSPVGPAAEWLEELASHVANSSW